MFPIEEEYVPSVNLPKHQNVLHFSDGILESFSDSESEGDCEDKLNTNVNVSELQWIPYIRYKIFQIGANVLDRVDYIGEGLASLLGITTPKHNCEFEAYHAIAQKTKTNPVFCDLENEREDLNEVITKDIKRGNNYF